MIFRPSQQEIANEAAFLLNEKIKTLSWLDIVDAITEMREPYVLTLVQAVHEKNIEEIGAMVYACVKQYYREDCEYEAQQWADRIEDDARDKAGRLPDYVRMDK